MLNERIETLSVAILIKNIEEIAISQIIEIAKRVKRIKIVTNRINSFSYIENKLYEEHGIAIQITSNREKALANSKVIINFDFDELQMNEFIFPENSNIVNIKNMVSINNQKFSGHIFNYYKITYSDDLFDKIGDRFCFNENVLYEGRIYRKDSFFNIRRQMESDGVAFAGVLP